MFTKIYNRKIDNDYDKDIKICKKIRKKNKEKGFKPMKPFPNYDEFVEKI